MDIWIDWRDNADIKAKFIIDVANHRIDPEADEVSMRGQKAVSRSKITCAVKQLN